MKKHRLRGVIIVGGILLFQSSLIFGLVLAFPPLDQPINLIVDATIALILARLNVYLIPDVLRDYTTLP